jgi:hypothetical protein
VLPYRRNIHERNKNKDLQKFEKESHGTKRGKLTPIDKVMSWTVLDESYNTFLPVPSAHPTQCKARWTTHFHGRKLSLVNVSQAGRYWIPPSCAYRFHKARRMYVMLAYSLCRRRDCYSSQDGGRYDVGNLVGRGKYTTRVQATQSHLPLLLFDVFA